MGTTVGSGGLAARSGRKGQEVSKERLCQHTVTDWQLQTVMS
jgi:hypothetical protein